MIELDLGTASIIIFILLFLWAAYYYFMAWKYAKTIHADSLSLRAEDKFKLELAHHIKKSGHTCYFIKVRPMGSETRWKTIRVGGNIPTLKLKLIKYHALLAVLGAPVWWQHEDVDGDEIDATEEMVADYEVKHPNEEVSLWIVF